MDISNSIKNEFKVPNLKTWKDLVAKQLKTDSVDEKIIFKSIEGINYDYLNLKAKKVYGLESFPSETKLSFLVEKSFDIEQIKITSSELDQPNFYNKDASINSSKLHNAGANCVLELTYILESFAALSEKESDISIEISLDSVTYINIAKLRALRFMLDRFTNENNLKTTYKIIATGSLREQTIFDPWVNMLRGVSSLSSALIGGADEYALISYDYAFCMANKESPKALAIRNTINMGYVLIEESKLNQVKDSARGSYAIENLTDALVVNTHNRLIQNIDEKVVLDEGFYLSQSLECNKKRLELLESRKYIMSGINDYVDPFEDIVGVYKKDSIDFDIKSENKFPVNRVALSFEKLRLDLSLKQIKLELYAIGDFKRISARANFCKSYFEVAAIDVELKTIDNVKNIGKIKSDFVCICAADEDLEMIIKELDLSETKLTFISGARVKVNNGINIYQGQNIIEVLSKFKGALS